MPIIQHHGKELRRLGVEITAHGIDDRALAYDRLGWGEIPLYAHKMGVARLGLAPGINESLTAVAPDIVHQHAIWQYTSVAVSRWRQQTGRPVVISVQGMLEPWALSNSKHKKRIAAALFEKNNLQSASVIHCSRAEVPGVRAFGLKNPIAVLPNGAVLPNQSEQLPRPDFLFPHDRKTLLFLGRIHPKKGISETLHGFAKFKAKNPGHAALWRLVIAGWDDGGHLANFQREVVKLGLTNDVVFPGPLFGEAKEATLAQSDAFILASHSEGFPMAVLEAWAHALPVFKTRGCNIPEGFDTQAAIEVTTDSDVIASRMAEHLPRSDLQSVGDSGRRLVAERFSWPMVGEQLLAVYNWILGHGSRPSCILLD